MSYFNPRMFSKCRHFEQDQILRIIWHGWNMFVDILDRTKYQGTFGTNQMSSWTFSTSPLTWFSASASFIRNALVGGKKSLKSEKKKKKAGERFCFQWHWKFSWNYKPHGFFFLSKEKLEENLAGAGLQGYNHFKPLI